MSGKMKITKRHLTRVIREAYEEDKFEAGYFDWISADVKTPRFPDDREYMMGWEDSIVDDRVSAEYNAEKKRDTDSQAARAKRLAVADIEREELERAHGISDVLTYEIEMGMLFLAKENELHNLARSGGRSGEAAKKLLDMSPQQRDAYKRLILDTSY